MRCPGAGLGAGMGVLELIAAAGDGAHVAECTSTGSGSSFGGPELRLRTRSSGFQVPLPSLELPCGVIRG